ncbi:hypothetical protein TcWFU_001973 [Taenia crassiceps]|uniref:Uncharacterized protein n=1 Tax=Taenia crassiceps TaxID=6207 RepID=A0ABR4Q9G1_9CEST
MTSNIDREELILRCILGCAILRAVTAQGVRQKWSRCENLNFFIGLWTADPRVFKPFAETLSLLLHKNQNAEAYIAYENLQTLI